ncbi:hypothetical protein LCGC14_1384150, partial [marine sediment metagenome]
PKGMDYFHCTSNNTIFGTQIKDFPEVDCPMVSDMSSDIFSRNLDFSKFDLIYAGAQKNMGPAGTTLVVVKEDILGKVKRPIPNILSYAQHIAKDSMFNTPPVFAVYTSLLTLRWLKAQGRISAIEEVNDKKATLIYSEIDLNPLFDGYVAKEDRSTMSATFNITNEKLKPKFDDMVKEAGINVPKIFILNKKTKYRCFDENIFPLMARKLKHARGSDIIFLKTKSSMEKRWDRIKNRDFLIKYIPKKYEYRIHVLGDKVVNVCKKIHSPKAVEEGDYIHPHVWSKDRGWTLQTIEEEGLIEIKVLAINAIEVLGYDFGAVDLIQGKDEKYYILEVNSAPRLNKTRRKIYVKFFRKKEKEIR